MLRTILKIAIVVWMVGLGLQFGMNAFPLLLVLAVIMLVTKHMLRSRPFDRHGSARPQEDRKVQLHHS